MSLLLLLLLLPPLLLLLLLLFFMLLFFSGWHDWKLILFYLIIYPLSLFLLLDVKKKMFNIIQWFSLNYNSLLFLFLFFCLSLVCYWFVSGKITRRKVFFLLKLFIWVSGASKLVMGNILFRRKKYVADELEELQKRGEAIDAQIKSSIVKRVCFFFCYFCWRCW